MDYITILLESIGLGEATRAPASLAQQTFYHGTSDAKAAKSILRNGLQPPTHDRNGHLTPVKGMVYLTPDLSYAMIYAAGGNYIGNAHYQKPYRGEHKAEFERILKARDGSIQRYGFVFEFNGADLTSVQPDEDEVGELYHFILSRPPSEHYGKRTREAWAALTANTNLFAAFKHHMTYNTTERQKREIRDGMVAYYASGGKRALKTMPDWIKVGLCEIGLHIAHQGPLTPTACYQFDKTKIGWMAKDGSNFMEFANKIR